MVQESKLWYDYIIMVRSGNAEFDVSNTWISSAYHFLGDEELLDEVLEVQVILRVEPCLGMWDNIKAIKHGNYGLLI